MGSNLEKIEKSVATIKIEVSPEEFQKAIKKAYEKNKGRFNIDGFRKGKAPQKIIENMYGKNVFYEDAIDIAFPSAYVQAIEEHDVKAVSRPNMENIEAIGHQEGLKLTVSVAVEPEVKLGEYKGIEIEKAETEPTEDDINVELIQMQNQNARIVSVEDQPAKEGDTVIIDFVGKKDGEEFPGGAADNHSLEIGSNTFIPGFEEQLIGAKKGDEVEVKVTFPEEYQAEDLAGAEATFDVTVKEVKVKELPELDDEFAKDVSEFDTLEELKEDLKKKIRERKENDAQEQAKVKVVDAAVENAEFEVPDQMVEEEVEKSLQDFEQQLQGQGISLQDYFTYTNMSEDKLKEEIRGDSKKRIERDIVLAAITEAENIEATDEEVQEELEKYAKMYNMEADKLKETIQDQQLSYFADSVKRRKTVEFLVEQAVEK
ncbi:MAG TPA: trigger factor [Eubacteriaceae bacterium]|nr:trigger factor [Eubacteriaceae bacterium]